MFDHLPLDLIIYILSQLSIQDLYSANLVSSVFHRAANTIIHKKMLESFFPHHFIPLTMDKTYDYKQQVEQAFRNDYRKTIQVNFDEHFIPFTQTEMIIFHACKKGDVALFLRHVEKMNHKKLTALVCLADQTNRNIFQWAGYFGHQAILDAAFAILSKPFVKRNTANFNSTHYEITFLRLAIFCNQLDIIQGLDDDLLLREEEGPNHLVTATSCCHLELVNYLVKVRHFPVPNFGEDGRHPSQYACAFGNLEMLRFWLKELPKDEDDLNGLFRGAIDCNNAVAMEYMLNLAANVNVASEQQVVTTGHVNILFSQPYVNNPIKSAMYQQRLKLLLMMLAKDDCRANSLLSDTVYKNHYAHTSILNQILANMIFKSVVSYYINEKGLFDLTKLDEYGNSLLHWIAYCNQVEVLRDLPISDIACLQVFNKGRQSPAELAALCGFQKIIELLFEKGLDINAAGRHDRTSLHIASEHGHIELVRFLLNLPGININQPNGNHCTPLRTACEKGHFVIAKMLVEHGADVNKYNIQNSSPLSAAAENGYANIVRLLLTCPNIDTEHATPNGYTALDYARLGRHHDCVEALSAGRRKPGCVLQ